MNFLSAVGRTWTVKRETRICNPHCHSVWQKGSCLNVKVQGVSPLLQHFQMGCQRPVGDSNKLLNSNFPLIFIRHHL